MTAPLHDDDVTTRLRAALADSLDPLPVGAPPVFTEDTGDTATVLPLARAGRRPVVRIARVVAPLAVAAAVAAAVVLPGGGAPGAGVPPVVPASPTSTAVPSPALVPAALLTPGSTVPMAAGQYRYDRFRTSGGDDGSVAVVETWEPQDPTQEWTERYTLVGADGVPEGPPSVRTARCGGFLFDGAAVQPVSDPCDPASPHNVLAYTADGLADLPTDPAALYERLRHDELDVILPAAGIDTGGDPVIEASYVFDRAWGLARGATGLSQPVSAALEQAIARIPGVVVTPGATTLAGLRGTSYRPRPTGADIGDMVFDAQGNFIGGSDYAIEVGAADAPLQVPAGLAD